MFTGLVGGMGRFLRRQDLAAGVRYWIAQPFGALTEGESISVSGACLTVTEHGPEQFAADLSPETLARTILGALVENQAVNLERALQATDRLGGHLVTGHVDGVGVIELVERAGEMTRVDVRVPVDLARYVAEKGSLTVDGVSLTVNAVRGESASLYLIPHTRKVTTLGGLNVGQSVNIEVDLIARYVERLLAAR